MDRRVGYLFLFGFFAVLLFWTSLVWVGEAAGVELVEEGTSVGLRGTDLPVEPDAVARQKSLAVASSLERKPDSMLRLLVQRVEAEKRVDPQKAFGGLSIEELSRERRARRAARRYGGAVERVVKVTWVSGEIQSSTDKAIKGKVELWGGFGGWMKLLDSCSFESGKPFKLMALRGTRFEIRGRIGPHGPSMILTRDLRARQRSMELGILTLYPGWTVAGRVLSPAGAPCSKALVMLVPESDGHGRRIRGKAPAASQSKKTDREGRFQFDNVAHGRYWIVARVPGMPTTKTNYTTPRRASASHKVIVRMKTGWLFLGQVLDPKREGIPAARIRVDESADDPAWTRTVSDVAGRFQMLVSSKKLRVWIEKEGYPSTFVRGVMASAKRKVFRLVPGEGLVGRILWGDRKPDMPVTVRVTPVNRIWDFLGFESQTDSEGRFEFSGLQAGLYDAVAFHAELGVARSRFRIPEKKEISLQFPKSVKVTFSGFTDMGVPLKGAKLQITEVDPYRIRGGMRRKFADTTLDDGGRHEATVAPGSTLFWKLVGPDGGQVQTGSFRAEDGKVLSVRFQSTGTLTGWLDARELPETDRMAALILEIQDERTNRSYAMVCRALGEERFDFKASAVSRGSYRFRLLVQVGSHGKRRVIARSQAPVTVQAGTHNEFQCRLDWYQD